MMDQIKKTSITIKNFKLFLLFFLSVWNYSVLADSTDRLATADSLFQAKKYTESFELYESLLSEDNTYSPAMLLKMAYIKEGLGDYGNALYFLNVYFTKTLDQKALVKMEELAESQQLEGYEDPDSFFYKTFFFKSYEFILAAFLIIISIIMLITARYVAKGKNPVSLIVLLVLMVATSIAFNIDFQNEEAIIMKETTYLMDGPSGSANVSYTLSKGHKLKVTGTDGVWTEVVWGEEKFYIRSSSLRKII